MLLAPLDAAGADEVTARGAAHPRRRAEGAETPPDERRAAAPPSPGRRALAATAAIVPGAVVHGAGHWVFGRPQTAGKLLVLEGIGLGTFLAGGVPIVLSGASRYLVAPSAALVVVGLGLFGAGLYGDLYGILRPEGSVGRPARSAPLLETRVGGLYVYDPQFPQRAYAVQGFDLWLGSWRLSPRGYFAVDSPATRLRAVAARRLHGPTRSGVARDGSFLDLELGATHWQQPSEAIRTTTVEGAASGRLDGSRFDRALNGSFAELALGAGLHVAGYASGAPSDAEGLLLMRFGYGFYFGDASTMGGEAMAYYDHRHDDLAAGLLIPGLGSGVAGHFGLRTRAYWDELGAELLLEAGAAYVAGLSLCYRQGQQP